MRTLLYIIRGLFVLVCAGVGLASSDAFRTYGLKSAAPGTLYYMLCDPFYMALIAVGLGFIAIVFDVLMGRNSAATLTGIFLGVIVGGVLAFFASYAVRSLLPDLDEKSYGFAAKTLSWVIFSYLSVSIILQTKDNFRFVIPYVEFRRQTRGERPIFLDTSAIIDGRIADLAETGIIQDPFVVPSFVLSELQTVADSGDRSRRVRGRRGLDILSRLRANAELSVKVLEVEPSDEPVDKRLLKLALAADGRVLTTDYNLIKLAEVQGVEFLNLDDIARSLRPNVLPGESLEVSIIQAGEEPEQGVGFLDDGTMVVVENGRSRIGKTVRVRVRNVRQSEAGRMIFGRLES